jgi:hypothetical protein
MAEEVSIKVLRPEDVDSALEEIYREPQRAKEFFERSIGEREQGLAKFAEEVNADPAMVDSIRERPIEALEERGLLGSLDRIQLDTIRPILEPWWPRPICRWECRFVPRTVIEWVCVSFLGWQVCFPRLRIFLRWECRIICF